MLVSSRHYLKPEVVSFIEMMLFRGDALIKDVFLFKEEFILYLA